MRKLILLTSCFAVIGFNQVNAQLLGINTATETTQIASWIQQRADNVRQLKQLHDSYLVADRAWRAVHGARDVGGMLTALGGPTRRFMPEAGDLVSGVGQASRLVARAGSIRDANQLFGTLPQAARSLEVGGRWAEEMARREINTANVQATADGALEDIQDRISQLGVMQARISTTEDIKDIQTVSAAIKIEQQNLALHSASLQALQLKLAAADRVEATRREQWEAEGAKKWADATRGAVDRLQGD